MDGRLVIPSLPGYIRGAMAQPVSSAALVPIGSRYKRLPATPLPNLELQHLWFRVADKRSWTTLALVPVDDDVNTLALGQALAQMAAHQADSRVLLVNASIKDCLPGNAAGEPEIMADGQAPMLGYDLIDFSVLGLEDAHRAVASSPQLLTYLESEGRSYSTALFTTDALLLRTPAIPLARSADAVILCVRVGHTPLPDVRKLVKILDRDRIIGSIALRPRQPVAPAVPVTTP